MSYARILSTGHDIYQDNNGDFHFDNSIVSGDAVDVFLYKICTYRAEELQRRIERGKQLCNKCEFIAAIIDALK